MNTQFITQSLDIIATVVFISGGCKNFHLGGYDYRNDQHLKNSYNSACFTVGTK